MRSSLKKIILGITLVIPVLTYIFLKSFGDNRYELPVYYQEPESVASCSSLSFPHIVDLNQVNLASAEAHVFYFSADVTSDELYRQLKRVIGKFDGAAAHAIKSAPSKKGFGIEYIVDQEAHLQEIVNCELMMGEGEALTHSPTDKLVLVDKFGRIRGYYDGAEFDDIDRLEVEIKILFTEYGYE